VGSVFRFTIRAPLADTPDDHTALQPLGAFRGLVVDDNPTNRVILTRTLERWGLEIDAADGGTAALQSCARHPYDLVIVDLRMPQMDGLTLARRLLADTAQPRPKVLMITASGDRQDARLAQDVGVDAYLTKPFRQSHLHGTIARLLEGRTPSAHRSPAPRSTSEPRGHILVVDDNIVNLRVALLALKRLGYAGTPAQSGNEAIGLVERRRFDFVFMDCEMPERNGFDTTMALRTMTNGAHLPIVALTAHATDEVRERCMGVGMDDFVTKPPSLDRLREVLDRWIPC